MNSAALSLFYCPALTSIHDYWESHSLDGITDLMDMSLSKFREFVMDMEAWRAVCGVAKDRT